MYACWKIALISLVMQICISNPTISLVAPERDQETGTSQRSVNRSYVLQSINLKECQIKQWGRDKMVAIFQQTFSNAFPGMKMFEFQLRFHWSLFLKVQLTKFCHLLKKMAWCRSGNKPLSEPMLVSSLTHICVTRPQWGNGDSYGLLDIKHIISAQRI